MNQRKQISTEGLTWGKVQATFSSVTNLRLCMDPSIPEQSSAIDFKYDAFVLQFSSLLNLRNLAYLKVCA